MKFNTLFKTKTKLNEDSQKSLLKKIIGEPEDSEEEQQAPEQDIEQPVDNSEDQQDIQPEPTDNSSNEDSAPEEETPEEETPEDTSPEEEPSEGDEEEQTDDSDEQNEKDKSDKAKAELEKQQIDDQRNQKFEKYATSVVDNIKIQIEKNSRRLLDDFRVYGIDETVEKFIEGSFIPQLDDPDEKLFLTLNMQDFIPVVTSKLSTKFLKHEDV